MATNLVATGKTTAKVAKFVRWTMSESDGSSVTGRCSLDDYIACDAETLSADDVRGLRALSGKRKMTFGGGAAPLVTVVASLPRPAPRASDLLGGTGSGRVAAKEDATMKTSKPKGNEITLTRDETAVYDAGGEAWDALRAEIGGKVPRG